MGSNGQQSALDAAQQELSKLKGSGKQLLEALAEAGDTASRASKVAAVIRSTEQAFNRAEMLTQQLGADNGMTGDNSKSRREMLRKRKANSAGHAETQQPRHARRWDDLEPAEMLQKVMRHIFAVTGYPVHGIDPSGCRVDARVASSVRIEIPRVMTAVIALASAGQPEAVRVAAMSPAEVAAGRSQWKGSLHEVFRRVSDVAQHALQHFRENLPEVWEKEMHNPKQLAQHAEVLQTLLLWLASYRGLFDLPCKATGQLLAMDQLSQRVLPPVLRPFDVDTSTLELIAGGGLDATAYHLHAFPHTW